MAADDNAEFRPYIIPFAVAGKTRRFFVATPEARDWYDPPKNHAMAEYEWIAANLKLAGETVLDVGSHHGHYALALAGLGPKTLMCVDAVQSNCDVTTVNLALNGIDAAVVHSAVTTRNGTAQFTRESNGRVVERGVFEVPAVRLPTLAPDATVIKLDIEGEEFRVLPDQLAEMAGVHTWIIEVHPWKTRDPHQLMPLLTRQFDVQWLNKEKLRFEPYPANAEWTGHTTVVCRR